MLSAPPRPSTETGPRGQGPLTRSIPTSIASELLRGLGLHSVHVQTSTSIDSSASTLRLRTRVTTGPQSRSAGLALTDTLLRVVLVRADATFRAGVVESDREPHGSLPERRAGLIQRFGGSSLHRNVFASERGRTEQLDSVRAPLERAVVRLKSWKIIRHDDE